MQSSEVVRSSPGVAPRRHPRRDVRQEHGHDRERQVEDDPPDERGRAVEPCLVRREGDLRGDQVVGRQARDGEHPGDDRQQGDRVRPRESRAPGPEGGEVLPERHERQRHREETGHEGRRHGSRHPEPRRERHSRKHHARRRRCGERRAEQHEALDSLGRADEGRRDEGRRGRCRGEDDSGEAGDPEQRLQQRREGGEQQGDADPEHRGRSREARHVGAIVQRAPPGLAAGHMASDEDLKPAEGE